MSSNHLPLPCLDDMDKISHVGKQGFAKLTTFLALHIPRCWTEQVFGNVCKITFCYPVESKEVCLILVCLCIVFSVISNLGTQFKWVLMMLIVKYSGFLKHMQLWHTNSVQFHLWSVKQKPAICTDFIWNASYIGFYHILSSYSWC